MSIFAENSQMVGAKEDSNRFTLQAIASFTFTFDPYSPPFPTTPTSFTNSKPHFLTILTSILHQFYLEGKSTTEIDEHFLTQGVFISPDFIQRVVGTSTSSAAQLINISKARVQECISERTSMLAFILHLLTSTSRPMTYCTGEIQGLCWFNGYLIDEEFVTSFIANEWIYNW